MTINLVLKNTFLDAVDSNAEESAAAKRSTSLPRSWKLTNQNDSRQVCTGLSDNSTLASSESTCEDLNDSEDVGSVSGNGDTNVAVILPPSAWEITNIPHAASSRCRMSAKNTNTRLNPAASAFEPVTNSMPSQDLAGVIAYVRHMLFTCWSISQVDVNLGAMGSSSSIIAWVKSQSQQGVQEVIDAAKSAFLEGAACSQNTYVMGYAKAPFKEPADWSGFSVTLATVPSEQENIACWDTYQKGFCPRSSTCRWAHPKPSNMMTVRLIIQAGAASMSGCEPHD